MKLPFLTQKVGIFLHSLRDLHGQAPFEWGVSYQGPLELDTLQILTIIPSFRVKTDG
jgi:hypothetical protein